MVNYTKVETLQLEAEHCRLLAAMVRPGPARQYLLRNAERYATRARIEEIIVKQTAHAAPEQATHKPDRSSGVAA